MSLLSELLKKTKGRVKDAFTLTEEEKARGKKASVLERIPMMFNRDSVEDFFEPVPDKVRVRDFVRELPDANKKVAKGVGNFAKEVAQSVPRAILSTALSLSPEKTKKSIGEIRPVEDFGKVGKIFLGERPIKDIKGTGTDFLTDFNVEEGKAQEFGPMVGFGLTALDLFPGTSGKGKPIVIGVKNFTDDVLRAFSKTKNTKVIKDILLKNADNLTDDVATKLADDIAKETNPKGVKNILQSTEDKLAKEIAEQSKKGVKVADETVEGGKDVARETGDEAVEIFRGQNQKEFSLSGDRTKVNNMQGTSFSTEKEVADMYTMSGKGTTPTIISGKIPQSKIMKKADLDVDQLKMLQKEVAEMTADDIAEGSLSENVIDQLIPYAKSIGKEAIDMDDLGLSLTKEIRVIDDAPSFVQSLDTKGLADARVKLAKQMSVNTVPRESVEITGKNLDAVESELKKLSPRRLKDAKKYGISEDVMARSLYAKTGGRLSHQEVANLAEKISAPLDDLINKPVDWFKLDIPKLEAYSQELEGYFQHVVKKLKAESLAHQGDDVLKSQLDEVSRKYIKAKTKLEAVFTEGGRLVQSATRSGRLSRVPGLNGKIKQVRDQIVDFANKNPKHASLPVDFDMALETVNVNNATELLDFLTQWNRSSVLQRLSEFQKASMLSAFSTHGVNALGNAIQQVLDIPVRALAGGLDSVASKIKGRPQEVFAGESLAQVRGAFKAIPDSIERAVKALGNEHYASELRRTEIEAGTIVPSIKGRFGKVVRLPYRLLQSADLGFRTLKKGAEVESLAHRIARKEGLKGKVFTERVTELSKKLPEDMLDFIDERTNRSLMLEELTGVLKTIENGKNKYPIMQFVIPFYRTLVNLSREAYRMTPIGGIGRTVGRVLPDKLGGKAIENAFHNKWTLNQATKMEEVSRQIIGTSIMTWVVSNMLNGDIEVTGPAPKNEGERAVFYGQGKLPHSIRVGNKWIEFQRVQPIGQLLQVGASISEAIDAYKNTGQLDSKEVEKEMLNSISDITNMVFTQSPFTGVSDLFDLIKGGKYGEGIVSATPRYAGQMIGTFIPNILRRATVSGDPIIYEKRDIPSQLKSRIPGLQKRLTPKRDIFGEKVRQAGSVVSRFASPIRTSEMIENKLYDEMDKIKYSPTVPNRKAFNEDLSVEEYETLQKFYGPRFRDELWSAISDRGYKTLNNEQKQDVMSSISRKVLSLAKQELFPIYAEKNQLRKQWVQQGYTGAVIEDALKAKFPYNKETLQAYSEAILERNLQSGEARSTVEDLLKK